MTIKATELINVHKGLKRKFNSMQAEIDALREALKFTHTELDKHHPYYSALPMFNKYELLAHKQEKE